MKLIIESLMAGLLFVGLQGCRGIPKNTRPSVKASQPSVWKYSLEKDGTATITSVATTAMKGSVTIPDTLGGKPVTRIGKNAITRCNELTSIVISTNVMEIGQGVFANCPKLTRVTIPASVTNIKHGAFAMCRNLKDIIVSSNNPTFKPDSGMLLSKDGATLIMTFGPLTEVTIPAKVTDIGNSAFKGQIDLTRVTIPQGVTNIGDRAFANCTNLVDMTLPTSVTRIGREAFLHCKKLTRITIPVNVSIIGTRAFEGCRSLEDIIVSPDNPNFKTDSGLLLTKDGTTLIMAFGNPVDVTIPSGVRYVGRGAFGGKDGLTKVTIPPSVTGIGDFAFAGCSNLTDVTIPPGVARIGTLAFASCTNLKRITIPSSLTSIEVGAFLDCNLKEIVMAADNPRYFLKDGYLFDRETDQKTEIYTLSGKKGLLFLLYLLLSSCGN